MIELQDDLINSCLNFSKQVTQTTFKNYSERNNNLTLEKAISDHFAGKLCEWYLYFFLLKSDKFPSKPYMKITNEKSFKPDLEIIGTNIQIHVKSCKPNLHSVLFEKSDVDNFLKQKNQFIAILEFSDPKKIRVLSIRNALDHKYDKPLNENLTSKLAIYL